MDTAIRIKRVYDPPSPSDGQRVLVDRLWPRGVSRQAAQIDFWAKDLAPSSALRKWFGHDPVKWMEFVARYHAELDKQPDALAEFASQRDRRPVTLIYSARDPEHNQARALANYLNSRGASSA